MIYFMQPAEGGPVKIGCSDDVDRRRCELEAYYGRPLAVLATMEGDLDSESEIHGRFAHLRFGRTEQFRPAAELLEFIGRPLLVGADPGAVEAMEPVLVANVVATKCTPEWKAWLDSFADECRLPLAGVIDLALERLASEKGFRVPPKRL